MSERAIFDLLIIGGEAPGLAAAACAAKKGAAVALLLTGDEAPAKGTTDEPPNAIWRMLDLHLQRLPISDPAASISRSGEALFVMPADPAQACATLAANAPGADYIWPAFLDDSGGEAAPATSRFLSAATVLDDYFSDAALKAQLLSKYVAPFGLAGDEAGSSRALAFAADAPRRRLDARALQTALEAIAAAAGVETLSGKLQSLGRVDGKSRRALLDNGREVRARRVMAASALLGEAAGLLIDTKGSPLLRRAGTQALLRLRYDKRPTAAKAPADAIYFTAQSAADLIEARDAMIDGAIVDAPVLRFEIIGKEIFASAPFTPAKLCENGELRDWTGQDRQILGRNAAAVIASTLSGKQGAAREIEVHIGPDVGAALRRRDFDLGALPAPAPSADPVGAAVALALELASGG